MKKLQMCLLVALLSWGTVAATQTTDNLSKVVGVSKSGTEITVTNIADKPLTAFLLRSSADRWRGEQWFDAGTQFSRDHAIPVGASVTLRLGGGNTPDASTTIQCVEFADHSTAGDAGCIVKLSTRRSGLTGALERVKDTMKQAKNQTRPLSEVLSELQKHREAIKLDKSADGEAKSTEFLATVFAIRNLQLEQRRGASIGEAYEHVVWAAEHWQSQISAVQGQVPQAQPQH